MQIGITLIYALLPTPPDSSRLFSEVMKRSLKLFPLACVLTLSCAAAIPAGADTSTNAPAASTNAAPGTGGTASGTELITNGGFETGTTGWSLFVPAQSEGKNAIFEASTDSPHSGTSCVHFHSDDFARFSIGTSFIPVQAGEHYHVSVWVRGNSASEAQPKTPGFAVRLYLRNGDADAAGGHIFISLGNHVERGVGPFAPPTATIPTDWTQIEAVVQIPDGVDEMGPAFFCWWTKGDVYMDDFSIQKVDASTPVTPLAQMPSATSGASATPGDTAPVTISDSDLLATLNLDTPGMEKVKAAAQPADGKINWDAVKSAYLDYRRTGSPARWGVMPSNRPAHPSTADDATADGILQHHIPNVYHFPMPAVVDMGKDFNWTYDPVPRDSPAYSDEWTYGPIGRTEFWETLASAYWQTGQEKYAAGWVASLEDFAAKNPMHYDPVPGTPTLWRPLDSAIRISISWPDAYYHFRDSPSFTPEANWTYLKLNYEHALLLTHDLANLNRTGNWSTTECGGLYIIGALFPEFRDAATWRQKSIDRLTLEFNRIVMPDGFEAELTPTYHFVSLDGFRRPLVMAKLNNLSVPDDFRDKIMAMYRAAVLVMDQSGNDVPTNDSKVVSAAREARAGLELADDPLLEWANSHGAKGQAPPDSTALPYAGFYAMRGGWKRDDLFLFFRAGPTGIGHQHEDMLEVVMRAWNKNLLFDPGTYPYDSSDWRRFANGTASHNTIIVDGKWQHRGATVPPVDKPTGNPWVATPLFDYVAGTYSGGYQLSVHRGRPFDPQIWKGKPDTSVAHTRRVLFLPPYYALVLDTLDGTGKHTFDAHFNLDAPAAKLDPQTHAAFSENGEGAQLALYPLEMDNLAVDIVQGQQQPLLGWMPLEHRPIPTIRFRKVQDAPAMFATFLYPYLKSAPTFSATPLAVQGDDLWSRSLKTSEENVDIVLAKKGADIPFSLASSLNGAVTADATGLVLRQPGGKGDVYVGGIDVRSYRDGKTEFSLENPASLVFSEQNGGLLCYNPGEAALTLTLKQPFARTATLAPKAWTLVSPSGDAPGAAPAPLRPLESSESSPSYADYLKSLPGSSPSTPAAPIKIKAEEMTIPANALLSGKVGAEGRVLGHWDANGTVASAHIAVPQSGWYRLKIRYCSGDSPMRSLLINGKAPFVEAEDFTLPATMGNPPSDGWSNVSNDWQETVLGADDASSGWKIYLTKGPCTLDLRNDEGGLNLDWLELTPA